LGRTFVFFLHRLRWTKSSNIWTQSSELQWFGISSKSLILTIQCGNCANWVAIRQLFYYFSEQWSQWSTKGKCTLTFFFL
jgi:hypothetical protein